MYSVRIRTIENSAVPMMNPATFAAVSVCKRKIESGISGSRWRDSQATNAARRMPEATKVPMTAACATSGTMAPAEAQGAIAAAVLRAKVARAGSRRGCKILRALIAFEDEDVARVARGLRKQRYRVPLAVLQRGLRSGELPPGTDLVLLAELLLAPLYYRLLVLNQPVGPPYIGRVIDQVLAGAKTQLQLHSPRPRR